VHQVIDAIIRYIQLVGSNNNKETLVNMQKNSKNSPMLVVTQTSSETLLNSFLYAYINYNPSMFDPLFETHIDDRTIYYQKVYNIMLRYFNVFKLSRNPFTVCWQLEVLKILSLKFAIHESKLDKRMKNDYHELFNNMLSNFTSIITDTFNIQFHETQQYHIAFPPTVYEMLWRYEYISFKSTITESQDDNSKIEQDQMEKMMFEKATTKSGTKKEDGSSTKTRKSSLSN
jgi:hypothetical protein